MLRKSRQVERAIESALLEGDELIVASVVYFEIMRGLVKRQDKESISFLNEFWKGQTYVEMTRYIWDEAVRLWAWSVKRNKKQTDADTLIAAVATQLGATVVTQNEKHFMHYGFPVINWMTGE
jgi:predicted nucleic acid-binding protein